MHLLEFLTELQNTEVFFTLLKSDCTTDALTAISKILGAYKGNTCGGISLRCSHRWVDWIAQIFYKERYQRCFSNNFPKLS